MIEIILFSVLLIPAMLGLADILHGIKMWLLGLIPACTGVLVLLPQDQDYARLLAGAAERKRWNGCRYAERIIALDSLLSAENRKKCLKTAQHFQIGFCSGPELTDMILQGRLDCGGTGKPG